jgi:hypothetical protein
VKVRCLSDDLTEQQRLALGRRPQQGHLAWGVTIGEEYLVLGLTFEADPEHATTGPYVLLLLQNGDVLNVRQYDLGLFTITDPWVSRYWKVGVREFAGRQMAEVLPPLLADALYPRAVAEHVSSSSEDEDDAWFAFLDSAAFRRLCSLLQDETPVPARPRPNSALTERLPI